MQKGARKDSFFFYIKNPVRDSDRVWKADRSYMARC